MIILDGSAVVWLKVVVKFEKFFVVPGIVLLLVCGALVKLTANGVVVIKVKLEAFLVAELIGNVPVVN